MTPPPLEPTPTWEPAARLAVFFSAQRHLAASAALPSEKCDRRLDVIQLSAKQICSSRRGGES